MSNNTCQVNFDEMNIEACYRSGWWWRKNRKMAEEIDKKKYIIRSLFTLKLSKREEGSFSYKVKKILTGKICLKVVLIIKSPCVEV